MDSAPLSSQPHGQVAVPRQPWSRYTLALMLFVVGMFLAVLYAIGSIYADHLKRQHYLDQFPAGKTQTVKPATH